MNRTNKILIIVLVILIMITVVIGFKVLNKENNEKDNEQEIEVATTTLEERKLWDKFLSENPYVSELEITEGYLLADTDLIKLAISSEEVETERIVTAEIQENPTLSTGDGYKKSKQNIDEYIGKILKKAKIAYNFAETYSEGEEYLLINNDYVYYTKIELPEREYILMELKKEGNNFEAKIYEYEINENNRSNIAEMLGSGNINPEIEKSKVYTITGTMNNGEICISTKQ